MENYLAQDTEIRLIASLISHLSNNTFIDIGAEKGTFSLTMLEHGMQGFLFEPMLRHHAKLEEISLKFPLAKIYRNAISNVDCKQTFYVATDANGDELDYFHSLQKADTPGVFEHNSSFEVECRSLHSLVKNHEIFEAIGILKTDTEGNDLNVLRGLGEIRPEVVICEYFTDGLYTGWEDAKPEMIIQHMHNLGYLNFIATKRIGNLEFVGFCTERYMEKQWGNLIFFREDMYLKAKNEIAKCLLRNENELQIQFETVYRELEEKEKVIQQLLLEKRNNLAGKVQKKGKWLFRLPLLLDKTESLERQIHILDKICLERLAVIEILDAEVNRLRASNVVSSRDQVG